MKTVSDLLNNGQAQRILRKGERTATRAELSRLILARSGVRISTELGLSTLFTAHVQLAEGEPPKQLMAMPLSELSDEKERIARLRIEAGPAEDPAEALHNLEAAIIKAAKKCHRELIGLAEGDSGARRTIAKLAEEFRAKHQSESWFSKAAADIAEMLLMKVLKQLKSGEESDVLRDDDDGDEKGKVEASSLSPARILDDIAKAARNKKGKSDLDRLLKRLKKSGASGSVMADLVEFIDDLSDTDDLDHSFECIEDAALDLKDEITKTNRRVRKASLIQAHGTGRSGRTSEDEAAIDQAAKLVGRTFPSSLYEVKGMPGGQVKEGPCICFRRVVGGPITHKLVHYNGAYEVYSGGEEIGRMERLSQVMSTLDKQLGRVDSHVTSVRS